MRIFGVLTIAASVLCFGLYFVNKIIERTKQLNEIIYLITLVKQEISYKKSTINEIFSSLLIQNDFAFLQTQIFEFNSICFDNKMLLLKNEEKKYLFDFFDGLGKSDLSGQLNHCDYYLDVFEHFSNKCDEENKSKIKLFPTLFLLLSMFVIILLL